MAVVVGGCSSADNSTVQAQVASDQSAAGAVDAGGQGSAANRPEGWQRQTHSKDATPGYEVIFADDKVHRLDVTIAQADWQAMLGDMTKRYGAFGGPAKGSSGGAKPALPSTAFTACKPLKPGAKCKYTNSGQSVEGNCKTIPNTGKKLACVKPMTKNPAGGLGGDDEDPVYVPCSLRYEGKQWSHVGIRFKGNSSLKGPWREGNYKLPFRLKMDHFEDQHPEVDDQRFYGFKKLAFANNYHDSSFMREKVAAEVYRGAGVPAPKSAFYRLYIDHGKGSTYFGLYTMVEDPDGPMLDSHFSDDSGNLYKPEGSGANWGQFDEQGFEKKTNEEEADYGDIKAAIAALQANRDDGPAWRAGLEAVFEVEVFLRYLAVTTVIESWDTYGNVAHNYYIYGSPKDDGRLHWIAWDMNSSMRRRLGKSALPMDLQKVNASKWPLVAYLIEQPVYRKAYLEAVKATVNGSFAIDKMNARLDKLAAMIKPYVNGPQGELPSHTMMPSAADFESEIIAIKKLVVEQHAEAKDLLAKSGN